MLNRRQAVLDRLEAGDSLQDAAHAAGVSRSTLWRWRKDDPEFNDAVELAMDRVTFAIENVSIRNALDPDPRNNRLRMFFLERRMPEIYGKRDKVELHTPEPIRVEPSHRPDIDAGAVIRVLTEAGLLIRGTQGDSAL